MGEVGYDEGLRAGEGGGASRSGLVMAPFRGVRFGAAHAGRLGAVTSPPYDVIEARTLAALRQADPHNVVRLILPESGRPEEAGALFRRWRRKEILVRDPEPVLYGYEQRRPDGHLQRGLLGAVGLRAEREGVILPHEDVMPGPVAGRMAVMRACGANLEPILLSYDGGGAASQVLEETSVGPALSAGRDPDGIEHRIWAIGSRDQLTEIAEDLRPRQALIADGHHRYAAYLGLQAEHHAGRGAGGLPGDEDGGGPQVAGPWDFGLALLVDRREHPLEVSPIHRVVKGLRLPHLLAALSSDPSVASFELERYGHDAEVARRALVGHRERRPDDVEDLGRTPSAHAFLVTDGDEWVLLHARGSAVSPTATPPTDTGVVHEILLGEALGLSEEQISYVHDTDHAVRSAGPETLAILLNPVALGSVERYAQEGIRMPRKSTSFGPKPRTGLVMRVLP